MSIASKDKALGRVSDWSTLIMMAGIAALPLLPGHKSDGAARAASKPSAAQTVAPVPDKVAAAPASSPAAPEASATAAPVEDKWSDAEQVADLRECLRVLAPVSAEVELEEPMRHGQCGTPAPLLLRSVGSVAKVAFDPTPRMNCRLAAQMARWVETVLQPAAREVLGSRVTRIIGASSYACRNVYNNPDLPLSQHATGSAVDIVGFVTADGRRITVAKAWGPTERDIAAEQKRIAEAAKVAAKKKDQKAANDAPDTTAEETAKKKTSDPEAKVQKAGFKPERPAAVAATVSMTAAKTRDAAFLKRLHSGACAVFGTVLGPEANEAHRSHFHFDVKERKGPGVCH